MRLQDLYAVIVTDRHAECRDFYVRWLGFRVVFEASWFVYLAADGVRPFAVAFMAPDHPSRPPGPEAFAFTPPQGFTPMALGALRTARKGN